MLALTRSPRWGQAVVRGRSMEPTLHDGDRLVVRYATREDTEVEAHLWLQPDGRTVAQRTTVRVLRLAMSVSEETITRRTPVAVDTRGPYGEPPTDDVPPADGEAAAEGEAAPDSAAARP